MHPFLTQLASAAALIATVAASTGARADELIVKIGHLAPLTGPDAGRGSASENAVRLALEELNAKGISIGSQRAKFTLISKDDAGDPQQVATMAQALTDANVNGVIGHVHDPVSVAAARILNDAGIPQISAGSTSPVLTSLGYRTVFRDITNDGQIGAALGRYAVQRLHARVIAIIDDRSAYGQAVADEFVKGVKSKNQGVKFASRQSTAGQGGDFNTMLTAIKASRPDVVFFGGTDAIAGPLLRQMRALDVHATLMGGTGICSDALVDLAGTALGDQSVYCAGAGGVTPAQQNAWDGFRAAYRKRFGAEPDPSAPYAYDAVMTLVDAMQQARSAVPAVYLPSLAKVIHEGVTGEIAFDKKGDLRGGTLTLYTYQNGQRAALEVVN